MVAAWSQPSMAMTQGMAGAPHGLRLADGLSRRPSRHFASPSIRREQYADTGLASQSISGPTIAVP